MKRMVRRVLLAGAAGFIGLQFIPVAQLPARQTAEYENPMLKTGMPPQMATALYRACGNCHTNVTKWPWYSRIAPMSWLMARDVERARKTLNFSEWQERHAAKPAVAASMLLAACESARQGRMPLPAYLLMHPESKLSPQEVTSFCEWSRDQAKVLIRQGRRKPAL
jgi:hypothetical protein